MPKRGFRALHLQNVRRKQIATDEEAQKSRLLELFERTSPLPSDNEIQLLGPNVHRLVLVAFAPAMRLKFPPVAQRDYYACSQEDWAGYLPPAGHKRPNHKQALGDDESYCASMKGERKMSESFRTLREQLLLTYPFMSDLLDVCE
uniref:Uncharacterized protein n=1 Tax=Globodera rostochiensis TaxID=31243 RepID=A0A914IE60_GLORO